MHDTRPSNVAPGQALAWLITYRWRWIVPTLVITTAATAFALLKPSEWDASQALTIRNEASNNENGPGRFGHSDERRTAQETVLELAKSRAVLVAALETVGPSSKPRKSSLPWPDDTEVDDFRENVTLAPPKGAELGRTEVLCLTVRDRDRSRAVALVNAVRDELEERHQRLRDETAQSMSTELRRACEMARDNLNEATTRVAKIEAHVGEDLGDLRMLHESITGETTLQGTATEIRSELRQVENARRSTEELLGLVMEAQDDPQRLVAAPNRLIASQPGLRRLKEGLVDAQLRTAILLGRMSDLHPNVIGARESEDAVRRNIRAELTETIAGLNLELRLHATQQESLRSRLADLDSRLERLAAIRASYGSNLAEMETRAKLLRQAEDDLSHARAAQVGADAASLIGRIDVPAVGAKPAGPGRKLIVAAGAVGGLLVGLGLLVLTAPIPGAQWEMNQGSPEVVVVVESTDNQQTARVEDSRTRTAPQWLESKEASASSCQRPPIESELLDTLREDLRMPENDLSPKDASGMTLKEALQRVGPA